MSKFSKGKKKKDPAISTAALPDIVFMLLFFFMVTTVFKEKESKKLEIDKVAIKETIDLEKNIKASYFWIGRVPGKVDDFRVQLDDDLINDYSEIREYLVKLRKNPEYSQVWDSRFFNVFKVDKKTEMRIVRKVHDELKEAEAFNDNTGTLISHIYPQISETTDIALNFHETYDTEEHCEQALNRVKSELSVLGEAISKRFSLEDELIAVMHDAHAVQLQANKQHITQH